jgi:hypothetical protein
MKLCRFNNATLRGALGIVENDLVFDISSVYKHLPPQSYPLPQYDLFIAELPRLLGTDDSSPIRVALAQAKASSNGFALNLRRIRPSSMEETLPPLVIGGCFLKLIHR